MMDRWKKRSAIAGLAACSFALAGCDDRGCVLVDDLKIWIAARYDAICAHGDGDWDGRLAEMQREYSGLFGTMMAAKSADRAGEKQLSGEMRAGLYRRLVGSVASGYLAIGGSLACGGDVRNVFPVLDPGDAFRVRVVSGVPLEAMAPVPMAIVGSRGYLQAAAGAAAAIEKAESGPVPAFDIGDPGALCLRRVIFSEAVPCPSAPAGSARRIRFGGACCAWLRSSTAEGCGWCPAGSSGNCRTAACRRP